MSLVLKPNRSPSDYVLDNLTTTTRNGLTVAFSLKTLSQSYTSPVVKLRHSITGATKDFYANTSGELGDGYGATGTSPLNWLNTSNSAVYLANEANVNATPPTLSTNNISTTYTVSGVTTFCFWFNISVFPQSGQYSDVFYYGSASSRYVVFELGSPNNAWIWAGSQFSYTTLQTNSWYHICIVWTPSTSTSVYLNGLLLGTSTTTISGTLTNGTISLGGRGDGSIKPFAGYISDFRVYNRVLTSPEIQYLAGILSYPAPGITNMSVYLPFQSSTSDLSGNNVSITTTGSVSYVTGTTIRALATVDTWYDQSGNGRNATQTTVGNQPVLIKRSNDYVVSFDANALQYLSYGLTGTSSIWHNTNYTVLIKEQRSSDKGNNYIHGTPTQSTNQTLNIGYRGNALFTHSQWTNAYDYTVNGFLIYDTTNTYPTISTYTTGTPILSIDSPYTVPEGSFGFDGSNGKYISINTAALNSGFPWWSTGGCTMECWVKYPTFTNASRPTFIVPTLLGNMSPTTSGADWGFGATTSGTLSFYYWNGAGVNVTSTTTISTNKWTHIAMTCDTSSNIRLFINGTLSAGPTTISGTLSTPSSGLTIGQHFNITPTAYISNLRIVKGAALYTANFTPSVSTPLTVASSGTTLILLRVPNNINRWQLSHHTTDVPGKRIYLNGGQVITNLDNTSISSPGQATLGRGWTSPTHYTGDLYEFLGFNISLPVSDQNAITTLDNYLNYATRVPRIRTTGASTQKAICIPSGNVFGGISSSILSGCVGAYSARRAIQSYNGPIFRLRRDTDNAEADVWADYEGNIERAVDLSLDDGATSGGTITYDGAYRIHTFTTNGTFIASNAIVCDLLVVGGGGSGGISTLNYNPSGGGGGGEVYYKTNLYQSANTYTVTVGSGGIAANGGNSSFGLILAKGGGKGGDTYLAGYTGGSGGGGARFGAGGQSIRTLGKGNNGGSSGGVINVSAGAGGGGGATQAGQSAVGNLGHKGGEGFACSINGSNIVYGSGGGGGRREFVSGLGGTNAGNSGLPGSNAVPYRGGGGGGADADLDAITGVYPISGGQGGSGIVIVRTLRHQGNQGRNAVSQWLGSSTATVTKWYDQSGNVNHVTNIRGNPRISLYPNDTYLYGTSNDGMRFPSAILPSTYTLLHTAQYSSNGIQKRIFDGVTSDWASGFLNGYAGMATHSSSNINPSPSNNAVITSLNGWTGYGVGGSPGPILDRSTTIPHISLNGTSTTVGDYFDFGNTTWNVGSNGGFTFIGMVRFNNLLSSQRIFEFFQTAATSQNRLYFGEQGTSTQLRFSVGDNTTVNQYNTYIDNGIVISSWQIFTCRLQNEGINTWRMDAWKDNVKITGTQFTATLGDRTVSSYIGKSSYTGNDPYSDIDIRELLWYNQALTDTQVTSLYNYMNNKFNVLSTPWLEPPITPYLRFQPYYAYQTFPQPFLASYPTTNTVITSINGATGYGVGGNPGPLYNISTGIPHISLKGSASYSVTYGDYFNYGSCTLNLATNSGFSFIGIMRFNKYADYGRIFEFGSNTTEFISLQFNNVASQTIFFQVKTNNVQYFTSSISVNLNQWYIIATQVQYISVSSFSVTLWVNNSKWTATYTASLSDKTYPYLYIGTSVTGQMYPDIDYRELNFYNQALPDAQINILYQYMNNKYNNQSIPWFSTPPITPYLQFNPFSLFQNIYSSNLIVSVDQNSPNLYRANGNVYNSTSYSTSNTQLSINYGASGEYSDWIVKDVVVFNNTLSTSNISYVENALMRRRLGILDQIAPSTKASSVAAYSFRLLTVTYMGPCVRIRRATDSLEKDFYASTTGYIGEFYLGRGQTLKEWLNGATGYVRTWYDQTGRGKHVEQTTTASQPTVVFSNTQGNGIYFNNQTLIGPNVFDTSTITNCHIIMASREIARVTNMLFNFNDSQGGDPGRFSVHTPWSNGTWYFDPGSVTTDRANSTSGITSVGQKAIFSGYKSSTEGKNGFRVNKGTRYLSSGTTTATVSGGLWIGQTTALNANHHMYSLVVFNTKLNISEELFIENNIAPFT